jgi:glycogen synthase
VKILMFGWEFPPLMTGGLGTACQGLVKSLIGRGVDVDFIIPGACDNDDKEGHPETETCAIPDGGPDPKGLFNITRVPPLLNPYRGRDKPVKDNRGLFRPASISDELYGGDLLAAVEKLARQAARFAADSSFDVIHVHDWMTFPAGLAAREVSGRPLVAHLHSTEYDRCLEHVWPPVCRLERLGLHEADRVITVSARSKWQVVEKYGVKPEKISVIHNGLNRDHLGNQGEARPLPLPDRLPGKMVLFLGRITPQKGPGYFIEAAARILESEKDTFFVLAGSGDMVPAIVERTAELGMASKVLFTGFLDGEQVRWAFERADVYVMPSVSDPFGISCLEAMYSSTPVVVSNQAGISEIVESVLKVDYWDVDDMAAKVVRLLRDPPYARELADRGASEARQISWDHPAALCAALYREVLAEKGLATHEE